MHANDDVKEKPAGNIRKTPTWGKEGAWTAKLLVEWGRQSNWRNSGRESWGPKLAVEHTQRGLSRGVLVTKYSISPKRVDLKTRTRGVQIPWLRQSPPCQKKENTKLLFPSIPSTISFPVMLLLSGCVVESGRGGWVYVRMWGSEEFEVMWGRRWIRSSRRKDAGVLKRRSARSDLERDYTS
jgi:hypothetical protein